jgi:hypothetical protein
MSPQSLPENQRKSSNSHGSGAESGALAAQAAHISDPQLAEVAAAWPVLAVDVRAMIVGVVRATRTIRGE